MFREVRFRYRHGDCWLQEATEAFPSLTLVVASNYLRDEDVHADVIAHCPDTREIERALATWETDPRIHDVTVLHRGPRGSRFHAVYSNRDSIYPAILDHAPIAEGPTRIREGVEHHHLVGHPEDIQDLLRVLSTKGTVQVEASHFVDRLPAGGSEEAPAGLPPLTDKQAEALRSAHAAGYYRWPRGVTAAELAQRLEVSPSAFTELLRHAEARIIDASVRRMAPSAMEGRRSAGRR